MEVLLNTDKNISGTEEMREPLKASIANRLERFSAHLTRVEVKLSDENADRDSANDKRCVLEVRPRGMQPIVVTSHGATVEKAVDGAIDKIKTSLNTVMGRLRSY